jgi:hemoglobin
MNTKTRSLFDRLGGEVGVNRLVEEFYDRVLDDPELEPFFRATPMEKLRAMQLEFFSAALDGPASYSGRPLHYVHQGRGITSHHLTKFMNHLIETIKHAHPDEQETREMIDRISTYADSVIDGAPGDSE